MINWILIINFVKHHCICIRQDYKRNVSLLSFFCCVNSTIMVKIFLFLIRISSIIYMCPTFFFEVIEIAYNLLPVHIMMFFFPNWTHRSDVTLHRLLLLCCAWTRKNCKCPMRSLTGASVITLHCNIDKAFIILFCWKIRKTVNSFEVTNVFLYDLKHLQISMSCC